MSIIKIILPEHLQTIADIKTEIEIKQSKFVLYQYCFSAPFFTWTLVSPAILVEEGTSKAFKYNCYICLFGWFGLPYGPVTALSCFRNNMKGGIDVTDDIILNIEEKDIKRRKVDVIKAASPFLAPSKDYVSGFKRAFKRFRKRYNAFNAYVAIVVDGDEVTTPFHVVVLKVESEYEIKKAYLQKCIKRQFRGSTPIEIWERSSLDEDQFELMMKCAVILS